MSKRKVCVVYSCDKRETDDHQFFTVPTKYREDFMYITTPIKYSEKTLLYICEDHFNIPEDCFESDTSKKKYLIDGCLPSKNGVYQDKLKELLDLRSCEPAPKRNRKQELFEKDGATLEFEDVHEEQAHEIIEESGSDSPHEEIDENIEEFGIDSPNEEQEETDEITEDFGIDSPYEEESDSTNNEDGDYRVNSSDTDCEQSENDELDEKKKKTLMCSLTIELFRERSEYYLGIQKKNFFLIEILIEELDISERDLYIVLLKVRRNEGFQSIGDRFGITAVRASQIFKNNIGLISSNLKQFLDFPVSSYDIRRNLPLNFRNRFGNVVSIIDCFETPTEKPSDSLEQSLTWSSYYNDNTAKVYVDVFPDGTIRFVSKAFGGRISDKKIVEQSGYLDTLIPGTTVMGDRGFKDCDQFFKAANVNFVRPPSVKAGQVLDKEIAIEAKVIACVRINVERAIGRIRNFKICGKYSVITAKMRKYFDDCVIIAASLSNLLKPMIQNE